MTKSGYSQFQHVFSLIFYPELVSIQVPSTNITSSLHQMKVVCVIAIALLSIACVGKSSEQPCQ